MTLKIGDTLPAASFASLGAEGPIALDLAELSADKKIVIFALPGAYTGTCSTAHMPSFTRNADKIRAKGADAIYCLSVNDVFVMDAWAKELGADAAGIIMLSDADASYTKEIGFEFSAPPVGLIDRSKRYSMIVENGVVSALNAEETPGVCDVSGGETILSQL
ncbi:peroxiredoxin [Amylibacter marinus]|uniref:Glutathione-dependent peroxiredoxin n=1 Tax=Amylibacter marinus TaxID=1475483 RepID=A0ABQ5VWL6_9RHOB|nr:peroxiredoxin [Amylibacter marinus]GLQ35692.1 peroxiredoxin [Amylibacter marinus]